MEAVECLRKKMQFIAMETVKTTKISINFHNYSNIALYSYEFEMRNAAAMDKY